MPAANLAEFVGEEDDHFSLGEHQCGAFGGIFVGILGACCVLTARHAAPARPIPPHADLAPVAETPHPNPDMSLRFTQLIHTSTTG